MKLYELAIAYQEVDRLLDETGGELTPEIVRYLDQLKEAFGKKTDSICRLVMNLSAEAAAAKHEAARLTELARARQRRADSLKRYLQLQMELAGQDKISTGRFEVSLRQSPPSVEWVGEDEPPAEYQRVTVSLDKQAALEVYKIGRVLPSGFRIKQSNHLRIR